MLVAGITLGSESFPFATRVFFSKTKPHGRMVVVIFMDRASSFVSPKALASRSRIASMGVTLWISNIAASASSSKPETGSTKEQSKVLASESPLWAEE